MVTGANEGIGRAVASGLAGKGATVVMVCRNEVKAEVARDEIKRSSGNQSVELLLADLSSLDSVRKLVQNYKMKHDRLHVLVNNAGVVRGRRVVTRDGLEETFVVNYLSHFLLTNLLIETLKASAPSRVVNVTSSYHFRGHIDFRDLQGEKHYSAVRAYTQSKLAQVVFTYELADKLKGTSVTVNCIQPGAVRTHLGDEGGLIGIAMRMRRPFMQSPEKGAEGPICLATSPELEGVTGKYFDRTRQARSSEGSYDPREAKELWDISMKLSGLQEQSAPLFKEEAGL